MAVGLPRLMPRLHDAFDLTARATFVGVTSFQDASPTRLAHAFSRSRTAKAYYTPRYAACRAVSSMKQSLP